MVYKYLGWGITNENGVAKLDHDAQGQEIEHSYTGTGAGEIDVVASLDNPVSSGSIVSGTFSVFDCYRHDEGLSATGHHNDIWTGITNTDLTREAEYTTIKEKTVGTTAILSFTNIPLKNYRIECDVYQVDGTRDEWFITVLKEDYTAITSADAKLGEWKHISLDLNNIAPNSRVRLNTGGSCTELRFKNFMLYPYGDNDVISINASNPVIQSTETTDITGSLFIDGVIQKNTNIDVYKNGTKVDTISTGSSGVASYTYTGSGAGATEFQFKYGSIVSKTYQLCDAIWKDDATQSSHNSGWFNRNNAIDVVYDDVGTTLTLDNQANRGYYMANQTGQNDTPFDAPICIECDILAVSGTVYFNTTLNNVYKQLTTACHIKMELKDDGKAYITIDDGTPTVINYTDASFSFRFQLQENTNPSVKFASLRLYPI